jgi:hypothetical protein
VRRIYKHAHFLPEPRDVIRHVRDLLIATFNSQTACQHHAMAGESGAVLQFGEKAKNCADLGTIFDDFHRRITACSLITTEGRFRLIGRPPKK